MSSFLLFAIFFISSVGTSVNLQLTVYGKMSLVDKKGGLFEGTPIWPGNLLNDNVAL